MFIFIYTSFKNSLISTFNARAMSRIVRIDVSEFPVSILLMVSRVTPIFSASASCETFCFILATLILNPSVFNRKFAIIVF